MVPTLIASLVVATIVTIAWVKYSMIKRISSIQSFRQNHHGYTTTSSSKRKEILLIVNPASGGGKAMKIYTECLEALEQTGHQVEVYVTESSDDMISLSTRVNLSKYSYMIAVLAGDSSIYEMVQATLRETDGKWPHAPILHLPGGTGNALTGEFHGPGIPIKELVKKATAIQKGSVLKCTSPGATTRYSLHNAFDGVQRFMIDNICAISSTLYPAFGRSIIYASAFYTILKIPFSKHAKMHRPFILTIMNSDMEGDGIDLGFGVNRFDDKLVVLYEPKYKGLKHMFQFVGDEMSGKLGRDYKENKPRPKGSIADVRKSFVLQGDGHYKIYSDGSNMLPIQGEAIKFEVIQNAIPYFVNEERVQGQEADVSMQQ